MALKQKALPVNLKTGCLWHIGLNEDLHLNEYDRYKTIVPDKSWYTIVEPRQESYWVLVRMDLEGWAR